jgi:Fe2+ or Zn2+ uptake regulation protein
MTDIIARSMAKGLRMTDQRRVIARVLGEAFDHPDVEELYARAALIDARISLATVYNCLETLTGCGLVKTVNHDRESARYCPNLDEHAHLFCEGCGGVTDIPLRAKRRAHDIWELPEEVTISHHEISFRGLCPKCAKAAARKTTKSK